MLLVVGGMLAVVAALAAAAGATPEFYRARLPVGGPLGGRDPVAAVAVAEQDARRLVSRGSSFHAAFLEVGRWEGMFNEREVNAFLSLDLPRNHAAVLPDWCREPRVEFLPGRLRAGMRVGPGLFPATLWIDAEVTLQGANQLRIVPDRTRLGTLPLPAGPLLAALARRLERAGAVTEIRRGGARSMLVVYIPSALEAGGVSHWLEAIRLAAGELAVAGETRRGPVRSGPDR
ncbi:MAG: hypothetical protein ACKO1M_04140 [Planctomycetota bacterium]